MDFSLCAVCEPSVLHAAQDGLSVTCSTTVLGYSILYQKLGGHTVLGTRLLHCTRLLGTHGYLVGSGEKMVSGNLPIETGRAQGCFFLWKNGNLGFWKPILGFWKPSESIGACSRLFFF